MEKLDAGANNARHSRKLKSGADSDAEDVIDDDEFGL